MIDDPVVILVNDPVVILVSLGVLFLRILVRSSPKEDLAQDLRGRSEAESTNT